MANWCHFLFHLPLFPKWLEISNKWLFLQNAGLTSVNNAGLIMAKPTGCDHRRRHKRALRKSTLRYSTPQFGCLLVLICLVICSVLLTDILSVNVFAGQITERDTDKCCQNGRCVTETGTCRQRAVRKLGRMTPECARVYFRCCSDAKFRPNVTCKGSFLSYAFVKLAMVLLHKCFPIFSFFSPSHPFFTFSSPSHLIFFSSPSLPPMLSHLIFSFPICAYA